MNSTILVASVHKSITSTSLNDTDREPHPPLDNLFVSIPSLRRISTNDRQSVELESNSEVKLLPRMKMTISTAAYRLCKNDVERIQHDNHFVKLRRLCPLSAIRIFLIE